MLKGIRRKISSLLTPFYIYDEKRIRENIRFLRDAFTLCQADIFFAAKANTSIAVLKIIRDEGIGAEVVSPGEIYICLEAGFKPSQILYNNIARKKDEVEYAIKKGIRYFNFESIDQALLLERCAKELKKEIRTFVRVNPAIFSDTHPHLSTGAPSSKFGIEENQLSGVAKIVKRFRFSRMVGIHCHIGSQILNPKPFIRASRYVGRLIKIFRGKGINIDCVNLGGGFGIPYHPDDKKLNFKSITAAYHALAQKSNVKIFLEPGRSIVGDTGYIITRIISIKKRLGMPLYIIDAGMTENPRPAIYGAYHHIRTLNKRDGRIKSRVAGPLCENSDEFGVYQLPRLKIGDHLVIENCGAYTRTMVSNYNGRLLAAEFSFKGQRLRKIRKSQSLRGLIDNERY